MAMEKARSQRRHANRRAEERYGIIYGPMLREALIQQIQAGRGAFLKRQSLRLTVWELAVEGQVVRVVYDSKRQEIVTFLPAD